MNKKNNQIYTFTKNNQSLQYMVQIKNNKHTYFRIKNEYVLVTTNKMMIKSLDRMLFLQFEKLYKRLNEIQCLDCHIIRLQAQNYNIHFEKGKYSYTKLNDQIYVSGENLELAKKYIYLMELQKMMIKVHPKVLKVIKKRNLEVLPIKYKFLKSKFGSYHRKHDEITLNTFLATLDPIYLEYVLYHEYAHKLIFNHSKDFYDILDTWMIGHKNIQKALKKMVIR